MRLVSLTRRVRKSWTTCVTNFHLWVPPSSAVKKTAQVDGFQGFFQLCMPQITWGALGHPPFRNLSPASVYVYFEHTHFVVHSGPIVMARERIFVLCV